MKADSSAFVPIVTHRPITHPSFGANSTAESGAFEEGEYYEGGDEELEEEIAKLDEYYYDCECR